MVQVVLLSMQVSYQVTWRGMSPLHKVSRGARECLTDRSRRLHRPVKMQSDYGQAADKAGGKPGESGDRAAASDHLAI